MKVYSSVESSQHLPSFFRLFGSPLRVQDLAGYSLYRMGGAAHPVECQEKEANAAQLASLLHGIMKRLIKEYFVWLLAKGRRVHILKANKKL